MSKKLQIQVPEPCGENWDKMGEAGNGRFCDACSKTVVDFTLMSDRQVLSYLGDRNKKVCGRFAPDQLNRDFRMSQEKGRRPWSVVWRLALVGMLLSLSRYGSYNLGLFNAAGALIEERQIEMAGKSQTESFLIPATLPGGVCFIRLSSPGSGKVYTQKLVVL